MSMGNRVIKGIDPFTLKRWLDEDKVVLIDVRQPSEYAREHIAGARLVPLSDISKADFSQEKDKIAVFYCRSGARTAKAAKTLAATDFKKAYHLEAGILGWKRAGMPTLVNKKAPIDLFRQVLIAAGSLVVLGVVSGALISPWFYSLSALVGSGLVFSGVSGICPMSKVFAMLPWNKRVDSCPLGQAAT